MEILESGEGLCRTLIALITSYIKIGCFLLEDSSNLQLSDSWYL